MKKLFLLVMVATVFASVAHAGKQAICHFPPDDPANFHTIVVSDNAVSKHVENHGDLLGSCHENCETICDDGDFCTQDVEPYPDQCICLSAPRPAVDCDDSNPCTADSCSSTVGACVYDMELPFGDACDDGDPTTDSFCSNGECVTGLVSYWNLDESSGTVFIDLVGTNNGLLGAGATMGQPGKFGNAIEFAGISGAGVNAFTATTSGMPFGDSPATVSYWVKKNSNSGYFVHYCYGTPEQGHFRGVFDDHGGSNSIEFYHWYNDTYAYNVPLGTTDWHLIVTVFDPVNSERRIYVDGMRRATQADVNGVYVVDGEPFRIGSEHRGYEMDGLIDDMAVWNIALDDAQVASLWNGGDGIPVSDFTNF